MASKKGRILAWSIAETTRVSKYTRGRLGEKEAEGLATYSLLVYSAFVKTFFNVNDVEIRLPKSYSTRATFKDRAPTQEELQRIIEVAPLREKAMIAMLATGGFRISTLMMLKYRHVKQDLEANRVPLHIHVEASLNKGKVCDYDTFVGEEAVKYLRLYLEARRRGTEKIPPENIADETPLFVTASSKPKPLSTYAARHILAGVFSRAGSRIIKNGRRYDLRVHSLRKFFRTQLMANGVPSDLVEYMMGHMLSTYSRVKSIRVEKLREIYAAANLRIHPQKPPDLASILAELIKARGENPSKYLKPEALPHRTVVSREEAEIYAKAIWEMLRREIIGGLNATLEGSLKI